MSRTPVDPKRLKRRRIEQGLSQTALAERSGISKQLVSMVENGTANFSPSNLAKIAITLDCTIDDLMPVDDALDRVKQLVDLVSLGNVTFGPEDLPRVAEVLGCDIADLPAEDLAAVADALGCDVTDLVPAQNAQLQGVGQGGS